MDVELELQLPPEPGSVSLARRRIAESLDGALEPERLEDLILIVSELLTNSVLHAGLSTGDLVRVSLAVRGGTVRGEVRDPGGGFVPPEEPGPRADLGGGWGLRVVDGLCDRWGVNGVGETRVWFELR